MLVTAHASLSNTPQGGKLENPSLGIFQGILTITFGFLELSLLETGGIDNTSTVRLWIDRNTFFQK